MPGENDLTNSQSGDNIQVPPPPPPPSPKGFWEEHWKKVVGAIVLALGMTTYNFLGDLLGFGFHTWFGKMVTDQREFKELVQTSEETAKRQKLMEKDLHRLEEKIDLQTEFLKGVLTPGDGQ